MKETAGSEGRATEGEMKREASADLLPSAGKSGSTVLKGLCASERSRKKQRKGTQVHGWQMHQATYTRPLSLSFSLLSKCIIGIPICVALSSSAYMHERPRLRRRRSRGEEQFWMSTSVRRA